MVNTMKYIAILSLVVMTGCMSPGSFIRALAKDPACVSAEIVTPWGQARITRAGNQTNSVSMTPSSVDVNKK